MSTRPCRNLHNLKVGQKVYSSLEGDEIVKVGVKYATLEGHRGRRIMLDTLADENNAARQSYLSLAEYEAVVKLRDSWEHIVRRFRQRYTRPPEFTQDVMDQLLVVLDKLPKDGGR